MDLSEEKMDQGRRLREVEAHFATHEAVCAERYAGIQKEVGTVTKNLDDLKSLVMRIGVGIAFGMASILASIAFKP
jgi:hypothetical protein